MLFTGVVISVHIAHPPVPNFCTGRIFCLQACPCTHHLQRAGDLSPTTQAGENVTHTLTYGASRGL